jgi:hypothetical protein
VLRVVLFNKLRGQSGSERDRKDHSQTHVFSDSPRLPQSEVRVRVDDGWDAAVGIDVRELGLLDLIPRDRLHCIG